MLCSPNYVEAEVPQIYISREPADHINFDITLLGYCDDVVAELCKRAGWSINHEKVADTKFTVTEGPKEGQWYIKSAAPAISQTPDNCEKPVKAEEAS